jgi:hypothetical protein
MRTIAAMARWSLAVVLLAGCGSGSADCAPSGVYLVSLTQIAGDCPVGNSQRLIDSDAPIMQAPNCVTNQSSRNEAQCSAFIQDTCTDPETGCQVIVAGSYRYTDDGDRGTGTITYSGFCASDGSRCSATVSATMVRQ